MLFSPQKPSCSICGTKVPRIHVPVISRKLATQWEIDSDWVRFFNEREGSLCLRCRNSRRSQYFSDCILRYARATNLTDATYLSHAVRMPRFARMAVAEINSCGRMHSVLSRLPLLSYSEYVGGDALARSEDMMALSYRDNSFDIVLHSETLEHVPDTVKALREIFRVLRPGGACIFTVPVVGDGRATRTRAVLDDGLLKHLLPPSFHGMPWGKKGDYLVFHEFGNDLIHTLSSVGFEAQLDRDTRNPALTCFTCCKPASERSV
ncbi:MAG: class I SAM-dependent methyltransferase [Terrimicrobiaceae bacterium]